MDWFPFFFVNEVLGKHRGLGSHRVRRRFGLRNRSCIHCFRELSARSVQASAVGWLLTRTCCPAGQTTRIQTGDSTFVTGRTARGCKQPPYACRRGHIWEEIALFIGPVFTREATIAPRRVRTYIGRATYVLALLVLMGTGWLVLTGTQLVEDVGDLARFGTMMFQILAPLQLALAVFFAALLAASEVAHQKDRHTLVLLLATSLSNSELVLGKLLASLLGVLTMLLAPRFRCSC